MKKAKILLTVIGISAVVGGAFAFSAKPAYSGTYFCSTVSTVTEFSTTRYSLHGSTKLYCSTNQTPIEPLIYTTVTQNP